MTFAFEHLDSQTRTLMLRELDADLEEESLYFSPRLREEHHASWADLLRESFASQDEDWLATTLRARGWVVEKESYTKNGRVRERRVPAHAHEMMSHGAFNHYYIRAVCQRALDEGRVIEIYRAKEVSSPRPESQARVGEQLDPEETLTILRNLHQDDTSMPVPAGPNSGLSVRMIP